MATLIENIDNNKPTIVRLMDDDVLKKYWEIEREAILINPNKTSILSPMIIDTSTSHNYSQGKTNKGILYIYKDIMKKMYNIIRGTSEW